MSEREDIRIPSADDQLAAYLYRPATPALNAPCVVMAHGFSATRDDGLPAYADAFRAAGYVVILFDYRGFGASTGTPRQIIDIGKQHDDYRAVVAWVRTLDGVDPRRIALWGSSFSGGHVLAVAAGDPSIAAVIAQAPFTDALPTLARVPLRNAVRATLKGLQDQLRCWRRRAPVLIAAVGAPGTLAAMTTPDAKPGFEAMVSQESLWRNEFGARLMLRLPFYRPVRKASGLKMPVLVCVCDDDRTTPPKSSVKTAHDAPLGELRRYPYAHFEIYHDPKVKSDQLEFLSRVLATSSPSSTSAGPAAPDR